MRASKGFTLIEVIVSVLITAVMVSSVFSISLTSKTSNVKADHTLIAAQASRALATTLQGYVAADPLASKFTCAAEGQGCVTGPSRAGLAPAQSWSLAWDTNAGVYALNPGTHTLQGYLPRWFEQKPYFAQVQYYVAFIGPGGTDTQTPWVNITVTWTEPGGP